MLETMFNIAVAWFHTPYALFFYWLPVMICLIGYFFDSVKDYNVDKEECTREHYYPKLTIGKILGRIIASFLPLINLILAIFRYAFQFMDDIAGFLMKVFNQPLVPKKDPPPMKSNKSTY